MIPILHVADVNPDTLLAQRTGSQAEVGAVVQDIMAAVRQEGDAALLRYTRQLDGADLASLSVTGEEINAAVAATGEAYMDILRQAANNIRAFHQKQVRQGFLMAETPGVVMGQKITPIGAVGVYVPGGTAAYPSTVLMDVIPAVIAGVPRIVMVTPPGKDGCVNPGVLAAAKVAGVTEIYKVGGAQAIAALAFGTQSIRRVYKIVGPGNAYVAAAKALVYGTVDIDMIAGPSDVLVVADDSANPIYVAADMLAQAEHDQNAAAVLVTTSPALAAAVQAELERQLPLLARAEIAGKSLQNNGLILLAGTLQEAINTANALAPEHLELCTNEPFSLLASVQNAGSIFLGHHTPEALGDYFAGPNHTLPTGGTARFSSPLSVDDFIKKSSFLQYSQQALSAVSAQVQTFAQSEGLTAHANSVAVRGW